MAKNREEGRKKREEGRKKKAIMRKEESLKKTGKTKISIKFEERGG